MVITTQMMVIGGIAAVVILGAIYAYFSTPDNSNK